MNRRRKHVVVIVGCVIAAALLMLAGRWERAHAARTANAQMHAIMVAAGPLGALNVTGYRYGPPDCMSYRANGNPYALQLCFDRVGRLVETVDRRATVPKYASLTWDPALATTRWPPAKVARTIADSIHRP
jgi:hypothetical protein